MAQIFTSCGRKIAATLAPTGRVELFEGPGQSNGWCTGLINLGRQSLHLRPLPVTLVDDKDDFPGTYGWIVKVRFL